MTVPPLSPDERRELAAELALGVLTAAERARALALLSSDAEFRAEVEAWTARLSPLLDEVEPVQPPAGLWAAIHAGTSGRGAPGNVVELKRRVTMWRAATAAMTALAASLAFIVVSRPSQPPSPLPPPQSVPAVAQPMVAMIGADGDIKLVANWEPSRRSLVLAVAGDMPADPGHAHELWVIPAGGKPRSLGTMPGQKAAHMDVAQALAGFLREGSTIAVSVEPPGGSPTGAPTGPVIASGTLESA